MKVAIAWYGAEGQSSYNYFTQLGHDVTIVTPTIAPEFPLPEGASAIVGDDAFDQLNGFDLVVRSSSIRPGTLKTDGKIWSNTNEFFARCPAPIIGVTGTKGKGTTCSLIASILRAAGKTVHLVGNIGAPALSQLSLIKSDDIVVYELSSFQLWDIERSPHVAVILSIEPDHLDVHSSYDEYVSAKAGIVRYQSEDDVVIYNTGEPSAAIAQTSPARHICYDDSSEGGAYVSYADEMFHATMYSATQPICRIDTLRLPGAHNVSNACAAITAALLYTDNTQAIEKGLHDFSGLPHRLQFAATKNGVRYYDDSIATTAGSAIAALGSFPGEPKVLILGGINKGADYESILRIAKRSDTKIIAIGRTGTEIATQCQAMGVECRYVDGLMDEVVRVASQLAGGQGVVILSPASSSFDQYKSYSDRGDQFVAAVEGL